MIAFDTYTTQTCIECFIFEVQKMLAVGFELSSDTLTGWATRARDVALFFIF
jgi:hypothetical protein